ncbi:MAG: AEC family transporter [Candidatus Magasanikbacteria bacterium]|jgi:malate permease and related proteins|nr:AEC family transporter [Candidatus Magasanikbacteria bacterium]MBT4315365.1 AEC family transporter [Candidatus Magasanikbacteria bacterium]MBT4547238.1 AEC family transporter [Candidatus Magasanikbacteria bacterium]MBT6819285.1 AEC family transporter [Candidatus Magasanikbacteria bacterium]
MEICLVILQLYIIIGAGFFFAKKFDFDNKILNYFIIYLGLPSLVFVAMYNGDYNLGTFVWPLLYIFVHILILLVVYFYTKISKRSFDDQGIIMLLSSGGNNGNFGIPVILFLLGQEALAIASFLLLVNVIYLMGPGAYFLGREKGALKKSIIKVLKLPLLYALFLGLIFNFGKISIPGFIIDPINLVGQAYIPVQLVLLGTFLAGVKMKKIDWSIVMPTTLFKLVVKPVLAWLVVYIIGLPFEIGAMALFIQSAAPAAAMTVSLADLYDKKTEQVALTNFVQLMVVIITLPLLWAIFFS